MLSCFVRIYKQMCLCRAHLVPRNLKTFFRRWSIFSANPWVLCCISISLGIWGKERRYFLLPCCSGLSCKFVPSPAELNAAAAVACRAALLPCQLCMSFVYIWFGRTFHDKNQGLERLWTGGWLGRGTSGWGLRERVCTHFLQVRPQINE